MSPEKLLEDFKNWAVVGVSADKERYGYKIYKKLKAHGYNVFGINPGIQELDGDKVYKSLKDLPEKVDVVNFVVNPKIGISVVEDCAAEGVKYIWLQPGTVSDEVLELASEKEIEAVQACVLVGLSYKDQNK
ncbi:hypothetical protein EDC18_102296 [Natranaerovirga pectinivora]|uniref:CoA-binding domain-containing protein n=1 Tax=Natranaerovirga pectinivora TaxID=682400 RepID=A0A4R3MMS0_9FIRM|nr:CoA-binding protein [Natranaerovirga pectinivora]TCT16279.1 hypothetical protein EDC18_102296 [Natranaerovirga pectinivora]